VRRLFGLSLILDCSRLGLPALFPAEGGKTQEQVSVSSSDPRNAIIQEFAVYLTCPLSSTPSLILDLLDSPLK